MKLELPHPGNQVGAVWYSTSASSPYPAHYHDEFEVNIVLRGSGAYEVQSATHPFGPASIVVLPPGIVHELVSVSVDFAAWIVEVGSGLVTAAGCDELLAGGVRTVSCDAATLMAFSKLCAPLLIPRADVVSSLAKILVATRCAIACEGHPRTPFELHPVVAMATKLLQTEDLDLECVARRVGLSWSRLTHIFTEQLGLPPVQYRNHLRIQHFIVHLHQTAGENMLAAALATGFGSYPQFHRVFRQVTGYSPAEHRRRVLSGVIQPVPQGPRDSPILGQAGAYAAFEGKRG